MISYHDIVFHWNESDFDDNDNNIHGKHYWIDAADAVVAADKWIAMAQNHTVQAASKFEKHRIQATLVKEICRPQTLIFIPLCCIQGRSTR